MFSKYQTCHYERSEIISFLILISIFFLSLTNFTQAQTPAWTQLSPTGSTPTTRWYHTAVYDTTNRMIIFGGISTGTSYFNDVWVLSHANGLGGTPAWIQLSPTGSNSTIARYDHTAVYDSANNRMTIFGGSHGISYYYLNDVWVLSTANGVGGTPAWTQLSPTGSVPTTRDGHTAVYDSANNLMIIFGGDNWNPISQVGPSLNDTWVLSHANGLGGTPAWTQLSPTGGPPETRCQHTAVYDTTNNRMIIFGGNNGLLNDVWVLSNANGQGETPVWTQLNPSPDPVYGLPTTRSQHTAVYDATNNLMTIFGGYGDNTTILNDVWVLSYANGLGGTPTWKKLSPTGSGDSTMREGHSAVYDAANNRMTIFGGLTPFGLLNDVWVLNNADSVPVEDWMLYASPPIHKPE